MADIDTAIDELYQGPLDGFTDARNALAKAAKRPEVKTLAKPSVPAWAVNQLYWHQRGLLDRLEAASDAVRREHQQALAGKSAAIAPAEQTHREVLREALAAAKAALVAAGQAATPATLDAVRDTLAALPSPEANGRLTRPLAPRGLEALAGLVLAARVPGPAAARPATPPAKPPGDAVATDAARVRAAREKEKAAEKAAKERDAARRKAETALTAARETLAEADAAVERTERDLVERQAERVAAREAVKQAQRLVEELSFGR